MSNETINTIMVSVIVPLLIALTSFTIKWLNNKANQITGNMKNEIAQKYICMAQEAVSNAVSEVMQTFVGAIKGTTEWNEFNKLKALKMAKNRVLDVLSVEAIEVLREVYGDLNAWLLSQIESNVLYKRDIVVPPQSFPMPSTDVTNN